MPKKLKPWLGSVKSPLEKCNVNSSAARLSEMRLPIKTRSPKTRRLDTYLSPLSRIYGPRPAPIYQSQKEKNAMSQDMPRAPKDVPRA